MGKNEKMRAEYGKSVLNRLSARLTDVYGKGWSVETLTKCRKFYRAYSNLSDCQTNLLEEEKSSDGQTNLKKNQKSSDGQTKFKYEFTLSWNHYQILMRIENPDERHFYEIEAKQQNNEENEESV